MLSRPEPQSFTRFTISVAVFLAIAALVLPGLVLRETDVLQISEREMEGLRPVARQELERRQDVARAAGIAAPFVGLVFFACAVGLAFYGLPRLKEQEEDEKARSAAELRKLLSEIRDQSESEREESLRADVEEDLPDSDARSKANGGPEESSAPETPLATVPPAEEPTGALTPSPWPPVSDPSDGVRSRMRMAANVEDDTLDRIDQLIGPGEQLLRTITVDTGYRLQLDGLLLHDGARKPDVLVEIKLSNRTGISRNTVNRLREQAGKLFSYRKHTGRAAVLWLIMVADETVPPGVRDRALRRALEFEGDIHLTVIEKRDLPSLRLPDID